MIKARFGPAGQSESFTAQGYTSSVEMPQWLNNKGLNAFEYQCGRGVTIGEDTAKELGEKARLYDVALSIHAPYFTNLANPEVERREKTVGYILQSCAAARAMGAERIVVHSGSLMKRERHQALEIACETLSMVIKACDDAGYGDVILCPELMGVRNQLGTLEEVIELCKVDKRLLPCIDFGHYNSRNNGILKNKQDYAVILDCMEKELGFERASRFHGHFSKIEFTEKSGEVRHLTFRDEIYGPEFDPLGELLAERGYSPVIICESAGTQAEDAKTMKDSYENFLKVNG